MRQHFDCSVLKRSKNINKSSKQISWAHFFNVLYMLMHRFNLLNMFTWFLPIVLFSLTLGPLLFEFCHAKSGNDVCTQWIKKKTTIHLRHSKYQRQLKEQDILTWSKWFEILFFCIFMLICLCFSLVRPCKRL